jgi:hypothetical protein
MPEEGRRDEIDLALLRVTPTKITAENADKIGIDSPRASTWELLIKNLNVFADRYRLFFKHGLEGHQHFVFDTNADFPTSYVLRLIADQIGHDLDVLLRIAGQRMQNFNVPLSADALKLADQLAYQSLQPAIQAGLLRPTTVMTYLEKSAHIRIIPYAPVALIGFPFRALTPIKQALAAMADTAVEAVAIDAATVSDDEKFNDLLSLPHEVGHYLYWHAPLYSQTMRNPREHYLRQQPAWLRDWHEELYADIYSCLVGGPLVAHNFLKLLFTDSPAGLLRNDGAHPVSALRGFVHVDILKAIGKFPNACSALEAQWRASLGARGIDDSTKLQLADDQEMSLGEARSKVYELVRTMLATELFKVFRLLYLADPDPNAEPIIKRADLARETTPLDSLYDQFVLIPQQQVVPELVAIEGDETRYQLREGADKILLDGLEVGKTQTWLDTFMNEGAAQLPFNIPLPLWTAALHGFGWVTGPTGPGNVKSLLSEIS